MDIAKTKIPPVRRRREMSDESDPLDKRSYVISYEEVLETKY